MSIMKKHIYKTGLFLLLTFTSCIADYLDVVPDNIATIDNAFAMRSMAERFLFTCYSWMPPMASLDNSPSLMNSDELWTVYGGSHTGSAWKIARGQQGVINPLLNFWDGVDDGRNDSSTALFRAIRECNIFLENIQSVPDMTSYEKDIWASEVKFLKAYYHFYLLRMYGPIPITDVNLPISSSVEAVKVYRDNIDNCFEYTVKTMDEAILNLPDRIEEVTTQAGRIDKCVALSMKAYVLVTAASPLFNGNNDYANFLDQNGEPFFNQTYSPEKWTVAATACKEAVEFAENKGYQLYKYTPSLAQKLSPTTVNQLSIRNSVCERWNSELIWGNTKSRFGEKEQGLCLVRGLISTNLTGGTTGLISPTLKMAEMFYTKNGVPIEEDLTWDYPNRYALKVVGEEDKVNLINGYTTASLNFDREDRFYACLGFDGGKWYGQGKYDETNLYFVEGKLGQNAGVARTDAYMVSGYSLKKLVHYQNIINANSITTRWFPWPVMRLANLYLLYAEALNEANGPSSDVYKMVDLVRERAGLKGVEESWTNYSSKPNKFKNKEGMRDIIQRERSLELAFEGERAWDIRRWKTATKELNGNVRGWNVFQETAEAYYRPVILFKQTFSMKEYFWPIKENSLQVNRNLKQNPGW